MEEQGTDNKFHFSRVLLFQILIVATSAGIGALRLFREDNAHASGFLMMIALPVAASIIAGSISRPSLEKPTPHWSVALALPVIHLAALSGLAALIRSQYTGIEAPNDNHPATMWSEWPILISNCAAQILIVVLAVIVLRIMGKRTAV